MCIISIICILYRLAYIIILYITYIVLILLHIHFYSHRFLFKIIYILYLFNLNFINTIQAQRALRRENRKLGRQDIRRSGPRNRAPGRGIEF